MWIICRERENMNGGWRFIHRLEQDGISTTICFHISLAKNKRNVSTYLTGQAGLVLKCHSSVSSFTSSKRIASSCCLSQCVLAPGDTSAPYKSHKPTPTNVASAR